MWKLGNPEISHLLNPTLTSPNLIPGKGVVQNCRKIWFLSVKNRKNWVDNSIYKCTSQITTTQNVLNCPEIVKLIKPGNHALRMAKNPQNWGVIKQFLPDYHLVKTAFYRLVIILHWKFLGSMDNKLYSFEIHCWY